jgi:hypothetical protein
VGALVIWLTSGLVFGLISFVTSPSIARRASSPAESQRGDRWLSLLGTSMLTLGLGLVDGAGLGQWFGLEVGQWFGLVARIPGGLEGLVFGLVIGL